jgi:DNA-binding MarR family transcriptional regulator
MSEKESILLDNEYHIMSEVADNEKVTQRELSRKLGVSVSTVNVLMNKMIREGLIKMTQVTQKQVLYMLTPVGMMEKASKTVSYLKGHYRAIYETKEKIKDVLEELAGDDELIYVLMDNDEMGEILSVAVHEFKSKHSKAKIEIIHNKEDICLKCDDRRDNQSSVLLHMMANEEILKKFEDIEGMKIINVAERL